LSGKRFKSDEEVKDDVKGWLNRLAEEGLWRKHTKARHRLRQVSECWWWLCREI